MRTLHKEPAGKWHSVPFPAGRSGLHEAIATDEYLHSLQPLSIRRFDPAEGLGTGEAVSRASRREKGGGRQATRAVAVQPGFDRRQAAPGPLLVQRVVLLQLKKKMPLFSKGGAAVMVADQVSSGRKKITARRSEASAHARAGSKAARGSLQGVLVSHGSRFVDMVAQRTNLLQ